MIPGSLFTVYCLTNKKTGRKYYGRSKRIDVRRHEHFSELNQKVHKNKDMQKDHKYGWDFEILFDELDQEEANRISDMLAKHNDTCYNRLGVVGSRKGSGWKKSGITIEVANEIRARYNTGEVTQVELAKEYGVTQGFISLIVHGYTLCDDANYTGPSADFTAYRKSVRRYGEACANRVQLRKEREELMATGMSNIAVARVLAEKYGYTVATTLFWMKPGREPKTGPQAYKLPKSGANLSHGRRRFIVDGVQYPSRAHWVASRGGESISLYRLNYGEYETPEARAARLSETREYERAQKRAKKAMEVQRAIKKIATQVKRNAVLKANGSVHIGLTAERLGLKRWEVQQAVKHLQG